MTGSPIIGFSETLAAARRGATVVTGTKRLARALQGRYNQAEAAAGREAWTAPRILPWPAWLASLWDSLLFSASAAPHCRLGAERERALWERVITKSPADPLLPAGETAAAAAQTWSLMRAWRIASGEVQGSAGEDAAVFLGWARDFECACAAEGWLDQARLPDELAARLASVPLPEQIVLAGFDEFTPQQQDFLEACRAHGAAVAVAESAQRARQAGRAAFSTPREEIEAAAGWARNLLGRGAAGIGVVVRDLQARRAVVERIFAEVLDPASVLPGPAERPRLFNLSAGPALASYPAIYAALRALELEPGENEFTVLSHLLLSRFIGSEAEHTRRAALEVRLRRKCGSAVPIPYLEEKCAEGECRALARSLERWRKARESLPERQRPSEWARTFSGLLTELGWPGGRMQASQEYQITEAWGELLSEFAGLEAVLGPMDYREARGRLARMARGRMFQPEGGAAPVQILGTLETPGLEFEHLWIAGLDDESWPAAPSPVAFLPVALQRARRLPQASPERELEFAHRITRRLLASAPDVIVSYAERDGDRELGPSPLILALPEIEAPSQPAASHRDAIHASALIETLDDHTGPAFEGETAPGGTRVFQYQATCPFRAFAELRLGAEALETPAPGLNAMERGTLVHLVLAEVWKQLETHERLCALSEADLHELVREAARSAVEQIAGRRGCDLPARVAEIEIVRLERLAAEWLESEKRRRPFTVVQVESSCRATAGGVSCNVKVDRVDRLEDGRDVIIDYKTGHPAVRSWLGDRPDEPQVPLYAATHEATVAAVLFGRVRTGETAFRGYAAEEDIAPGAETADIESQIAQWRAVLDRLGADFLSGAAGVSPKDVKACRRCSLLPLCRFAEAEVPASALDEGEDHA